MQTVASSRSFAEALAAWLATRVPPGRYGALVALLVVAAGAGGGPDLRWMLGAGVLAAALLFQFRLWDDLADSERDRVRHPDRVLPQCESQTGFRRTAAIAFVANALVVAAWNGPWAAALLVALGIVFAAWYRRPLARRSGLANAHVVTLKYPVFVLVLSAPPHQISPLLAAGAATYLAFGAYEILHDPVCRAAPGAAGLLAAELTALTVMFAAVLWGRLSDSRVGIVPGAILCIALVAALCWLLRRWRGRAQVGLWAYSPFVVCLAVLAGTFPGLT